MNSDPDLNADDKKENLYDKKIEIKEENHESENYKTMSIGKWILDVVKSQSTRVTNVTEPKKEIIEEKKVVEPVKQIIKHVSDDPNLSKKNKRKSLLDVFKKN